MRLNAVKILKISVTTSSKKTILEETQKYLEASDKKSQKSLKIYTPNTEQLARAQRDSHFLKVLNRADIAIPDTVGVVWAGHILVKNGPTTPIPGVEFMEDLVNLAANRHVPVGLIGGRGNLAVDTLNCLQKKYPGLIGWAVDGPEIKIQNSTLRIENEDEKIYFARLSRRIVREETCIIFVALGPPKQEMFIERITYHVSRIRSENRKRNLMTHDTLTLDTPLVLMAVGGSFDILSGRLPRAPLYFRKLGLEWFWRLILEPRRIFRQLALIEFVWLVIREKLASKGLAL